MGTSLDSLNTNAGVRFTHVALIEGYPYALTNGDVSAVFASLDDSATAAHNAYTEVLGGLEVAFEDGHRTDPWKGMDEGPPAITLRVAPGRLYSGGDSGALFGTFGRDVAKRSGGNETRLSTSLSPDGTSFEVKSSDLFAAGPSTVYIGAEAITYDTNDTGVDEFSDLTRARWTPCFTESLVNFARSHRAIDIATITGDPTGVRALPLVSSEPRKWIGRWVEVWIVVDRGGVLDVMSEGHRIFAGQIRGTGRDESGRAVIECEHVRRVIYETQILRDQFRAQLVEGVTLSTGQYFQCRHVRVVGATTTIGDAAVLTVVASGASGANQIDAGVYTAHEIGEAITNWFRAELDATNLLFTSTYDGAYNSPQASRLCGHLFYRDPTIVADSRRVVLIVPSDYIAKFLGWDGASIALQDTSRTSEANSPHVPMRIDLRTPSGSAERVLTNPSGTWVDQNQQLPLPLRDVAGITEGIVKIGDFGYATAIRTSDTLFTLGTITATELFSTLNSDQVITIDDDRALDITQVAVMEGTFKELLLNILLSTGTQNYNSTYDQVGASLACAIPYSLLTDAFVTDLSNIAETDRTIAMIVDKPTRFVDLFQADLLLRWSHFLWRDGRLAMRAWTTPTTGALGAVEIAETDRGESPEGGGDEQRSSSFETFEMMQNIVKIDYDRRADGELVSDVAVEDLDSIASHGHRGYTIKARNTAGMDATGDLRGLLGAWSTAWPLFSRPFTVITRSMPRQLFGQLAPLTPVLVTDRSVPAPDTGLTYDPAIGAGGLVGWPGIVLGNKHDYGASVIGVNGAPTYRATKGWVEIAVWERNDVAPYSPCAEVDSGAANGGLDAGTSTVFTCKAHEHSGASDAADASHFPVTHKIRIRQIDPSSAGSALSWDRVVASQTGNTITVTVAIAAPAWDPALLYEIVSDTYADATAVQRGDTYQADAADYLVVDTRQPYALAQTGSSQSNPFTPSVSTDVPSRHSTLEYGDGVALDTGSDRRIARLANSLVSHKTAPQAAAITREAWTFGGAGTWELVAIVPVFVGVGQLGANASVPLSIAPMFRSTDGTDARVRYTLSPHWPLDDDRDDVALLDPYVQTTFTRASMTYAVPTPATLETTHITRTPGQFGGLAWLWVEIDAKASLLGPFAHYRVGPTTHPSPPLIHVDRDVRNTHVPSAAFYRRAVEAENRITGYGDRMIFCKAWLLGATPAGAAGTVAVARFRFRSRYGAARLRIVLVFLPTDPFGSTIDPTFTVAVTEVGVGATTKTYAGTADPAATSDDRPSDWRIGIDAIALTPNAVHEVVVSTLDHARLAAVECHEIGNPTISEATDYYNASSPQAGSPILDTTRSRLLIGLSNMYRANGGTLAHWSKTDGSATTRTSATAINLFDNTTTGAPSAATPGWYLDMSYRCTQARPTSVPFEFSIYGSIGAGSGTVKLLDSAGNVLATVTINGGAGWYTATGVLPTTAGKFDLQLAGDGVNAVSVFAASLQEWEAA